jgi:acetyl esterase/lipase
VLRNEGEATAPQLRAAGVPATTVHDDGTINDFMMLNPLTDTKVNPLTDTKATGGAIAQARAPASRMGCLWHGGLTGTDGWAGSR